MIHISDSITRVWVCLICATKNQLGQMIAADTLRCPHCRSANISPGDGAVQEADEGWGPTPGETIH